MSAEDEWSRITAYGLEAATPKTTVTATWGIYGGEAQLSTVSSTIVLKCCLFVKCVFGCDECCVILTVNHSVRKFGDSTAVRSHCSRPHNKYSLQYLYWNRPSTIKLFFLKIEKIRVLELELEHTNNDCSLF